MNLYDTKQINCYRYDKWLGEVDREALIIYPKCGSCADPYPVGYDLVPSLEIEVQKTKRTKINFNDTATDIGKGQ